jgi:hypothetical protein
MAHLTSNKDVFTKILHDTNSKYVFFKKNNSSADTFKINIAIAKSEGAKATTTYGLPAERFEQTIYSRLMTAEKNEIENIVPGLRLVFENTSKHGDVNRIFELR